MRSTRPTRAEADDFYFTYIDKVPDGDVVERTGISEQRVLHGTVELHDGETTAVRWGAWPALFVALAALVATRFRDTARGVWDLIRSRRAASPARRRVGCVPPATRSSSTGYRRSPGATCTDTRDCPTGPGLPRTTSSMPVTWPPSTWSH